MSLSLTVKGMHCKSCKMLIEEELEDLGATNIVIEFDPDSKIGTVKCTGIDKDAAIEIIEELGEYTVL